MWKSGKNTLHNNAVVRLCNAYWKGMNGGDGEKCGIAREINRKGNIIMRPSVGVTFCFWGGGGGEKRMPSGHRGIGGKIETKRIQYQINLRTTTI